MVLTRKNHFKQYPFVDRDDYIQTFIEAINNIGQKEFSVLVYYGIAGIGKTSLRKELPKYLDEYYVEYPNKKLVWASIDLQFDKHREKTTFLVSLKNELQKKYKINFPAFEIAHAIYRKKVNSEIPLIKENYLFFEGDNAFDDFFGIVNQIPYFSIVPATGKLIKSSLTSLQKWWKTIGEAEFLQLSEKEPQEIEDSLPDFWAQDLNNYLERASKSAVLFIDTYEALWEKERGQGTFNSRDEWIRELILNLPNSSLWVICGREKLRWNEVNRDWSNYLEQHNLEKLPKKYALIFINLCGIKENEIKRVILKASECVPYYLELEIDTYTEISKTRSPKPDDFAKTHSEIFDRFMKYLNGPEQETLKVLSIPRFWNRDIFNSLIEKFNTGYSLTAFSELKRFSFVQETEGKLLLHPLMRESLQVYQDQEVRKEVHSFMCDYYTNQLNSIDVKAITPEHELALTEAFYHAKESLETKDLFSWFLDISDPFNRAALWQLIFPMYKELLQVLETEPEIGHEHLGVATTLNNLAGLYENMGNYKKALPLYERALTIREKVLEPEHPDVASSLNNIAALYCDMGYYKKALPLFQRALTIRENVLGPEHPDVATTLNNLAVLYCNTRDYEKALLLHQRALKIVKNVLGSEHPYVASSLNNIAGLYESMGDYKKALPLYERALVIREKVLEPKHPSVASSLNNIAVLYYNTGAYEKALPLYERALEIYKNVLGSEHPYVATTLNNIAGLYESMGDYKKALPLYQEALEIVENVLGPEHPYVATTLNNIAALYYNMGAYEKVAQLKEKYPAFFEKTGE